MSERHGIVDTIMDSLAPVHRDGHKFIAIAVGLALLFFLIWPPLAWLLLLVAAVDRLLLPRSRPRDAACARGWSSPRPTGASASIETVRPPVELGLGPRSGVSASRPFFRSSTCTSRGRPWPGRIARSIYVPGAFLNAALDKASEENERRAIVIERSDGVEIAVVQIAGLIARRIVAFVHEGDSVGVGERLGLIRFGIARRRLSAAGKDGAGLGRAARHRRRDGARRPEIGRAGAGVAPELS